MNVVNIASKFNLIQDHWHPRIVGELNDSYIKLVKLKGEFIWHKHEVEDELFLVIKGRLRMMLRDQELSITEGEFVIIPHGMEHKPVADEEVHVVLLEPKSTVNTGDVQSDLTIQAEWI
jgi:mannose-6-phosphate isomerase-like protein (cupin superfamily)